jgi:two-component system, NarL family, invasion response regulator UvrY
VVLRGCSRLFEDAGVDNIIQTQSWAVGFSLYRKHKPDVIIVDLKVGAGVLNGLSFIRRLRLQDQHTPVLVFTMESDPATVRRAIAVGATGYVLKDATSEELLKAYERLREGRPYISYDLALKVAFRDLPRPTNPLRIN